MAVYAAFLRGINVNGVTIKMEALREVLAVCGCTGAKTVLATGNAVFSFSEGVEKQEIKHMLEAVLSKRFSYDAHLILRTGDEVRRIAEAAQNFAVDKATHLYYLFFEGEAVLHELADAFAALPHSENETFTPFLRGAFWTVKKGETLSSAFGAKVLGAARYRDAVTSRNANTLQKVCAALPQVEP
ncbi:MAG TPA: DUF1697 domain-containing protein [Clostridia bacterium]|nr:DUF1697 domain-containing protein [Clostridia bacterium]